MRNILSSSSNVSGFFAWLELATTGLELSVALILKPNHKTHNNFSSWFVNVLQKQKQKKLKKYKINLRNVSLLVAALGIENEKTIKPTVTKLKLDIDRYMLEY